MSTPALKEIDLTPAAASPGLPAMAGATPMTPMDMLAHAVNSGAGLEMVEKLMALQERWEANNARKAFNEAFAAFKAEAIVVVRNRRVTDGPLKNKSYAELFSFVDAATPALSKHGLSHSWKVLKDEKDTIEVACIIEHVLGGSKEVSLSGPPDTGSARNALQARISTVTYLKRETFKLATGLAEQGDDNDGRGGAKEDQGGPISEEQAAVIRKLIEDTGTDIVVFCKYYKIEAVPDLPASKFSAAKVALDKKPRVQK